MEILNVGAIILVVSDVTITTAKFGLVDLWVLEIIWLLSKDQHKTFIAKLSSPDKTQTSIVSQQASQIKAFPQPFTEQFSFEFEINQAQVLHFALLDMKGAWMQDLLTKEVKKGKNAFLFENASLSPGLYFLQVSNSQGKVLFTHKIMKQ
jgi:hypothetical protein